jgi:hypothetical protein
VRPFPARAQLRKRLLVARFLGFDEAAEVESIAWRVRHVIGAEALALASG